ncbi:MAG: hypothetical protein EZS28_046810, partial [Streblomastix strix]
VRVSMSGCGRTQLRPSKLIEAGWAPPTRHTQRTFARNSRWRPKEGEARRSRRGGRGRNLPLCLPNKPLRRAGGCKGALEGTVPKSGCRRTARRLFRRRWRSGDAQIFSR